MWTKHTFPNSSIRPSSGELHATVRNNQNFTTKEINFAYDYNINDRQLRTILSATSLLQHASGKSVQGIEMIFDANISNGNHLIEDKKFYACYWLLWNDNNGYLRLDTYDAEEGSITINFGNKSETYQGEFSFRAYASDIDGIPIDMEIKSGDFLIKGRDNFNT